MSVDDSKSESSRFMFIGLAGIISDLPTLVRSFLNLGFLGLTGIGEALGGANLPFEKAVMTSKVIKISPALNAP